MNHAPIKTHFTPFTNLLQSYRLFPGIYTVYDLNFMGGYILMFGAKNCNLVTETDDVTSLIC